MRAFVSVAVVVGAVVGIDGCHVLGITGEPCRGAIDCPASDHCDLATHECAAGAGEGEGAGSEGEGAQAGEGEGAGSEGEGAHAGEGEGTAGDGEGEGAQAGEGEGAEAGEGEGAQAGEGEGAQAGEGEGEGAQCTDPGPGSIAEAGNFSDFGDPNELVVGVTGGCVLVPMDPFGTDSAVIWPAATAPTTATCHLTFTALGATDIDAIKLSGAAFTTNAPSGGLSLGQSQSFSADITAITPASGSAIGDLRIAGQRVMHVLLEADAVSATPGLSLIPNQSCTRFGGVDDVEGAFCGVAIENASDAVVALDSITVDTNAFAVGTLSAGSFAPNTFPSSIAAHATLPILVFANPGAGGPHCDQLRATSAGTTTTLALTETLAAPNIVVLDNATAGCVSGGAGGAIGQCSVGNFSGSSQFAFLTLQNLGTTTMHIESINEVAGDGIATIRLDEITPVILAPNEVRGVTFSMEAPPGAGAPVEEQVQLLGFNARNYGAVDVSGFAE